MYVFGDSFMTQDTAFPGEHWTELVADYDVVMRSQSGCSNGMIAYEVLQSLKELPDAVVLGFTAEMRLNFDASDTDDGRLWRNNGNSFITEHEKLACDYYAATVSERMVLIETYLKMRGLFLTLERHKIPYAWTPMMLDNNLAQPRCETLDWIDILSEFDAKKTPLNLSTYPVFSSNPGFHTHNHSWQLQFAQQAQTIIQQQVEFYKN